jgi:hypothetical protein
MSWSAALALALHALWRNKTRAMLTALGVIIGVASVIAMVAIGAGAHHHGPAQAQGHHPYRAHRAHHQRARGHLSGHQRDHQGVAPTASNGGRRG